VLLKKGEANLAKASVVNVSQILAVDKADLVECTGKLSGAADDQRQKSARNRTRAFRITVRLKLCR